MTEQQAYNQQLIEQFRATRGSQDWPFAGRPLLLLTATGAKSGQQRTTPMMYVPDGDTWLVIASNAGAARHPDWYHNLMAHPEVTVEIGDETIPATASLISGDERAPIWKQIVASYPFFAEHQAQTTREIPVFRLRRADRAD